MTLENAKRLYKFYTNSHGEQGKPGYIAPQPERAKDVLKRHPEFEQGKTVQIPEPVTEKKVTRNAKRPPR